MVATRVHLTFVLDDSTVPQLAAARHRWDPLMARGVPPHVTLVYPEEYGDESLLLSRAEEAASGFGPFTMQTQQIITDGDNGFGGVFTAISVPTNTWADLRHAILQPPFVPVEIEPHITLVHPRTSRQGVQAWSALQDVPATNNFVVSEFCLTATSPDDGMHVRHRFELTGRSRQVCAAVILTDRTAGLVALRAPDRRWYPSVWDLVGGRVEPGERLADTACREAREELGVSLQAEDLSHIDTLVTNDAEVAVFAATSWTGEPYNAASVEHSEIRWCSPTDLDLLTTSHPELSNLVAKAMASQHQASG